MIGIEPDFNLNLNEYDIMLLLKGRRIRGQTSENIKELIAYIKRNNYFEDGNNNRKTQEFLDKGI